MKTTVTLMTLDEMSQEKREKAVSSNVDAMRDSLSEVVYDNLHDYVLDLKSFFGNGIRFEVKLHRDLSKKIEFVYTGMNEEKRSTLIFDYYKLRTFFSDKMTAYPDHMPFGDIVKESLSKGTRLLEIQENIFEVIMSEIALKIELEANNFIREFSKDQATRLDFLTGEFKSPFADRQDIGLFDQFGNFYVEHICF